MEREVNSRRTKYKNNVVSAPAAAGPELMGAEKDDATSSAQEERLFLKKDFRR